MALPRLTREKLQFVTERVDNWLSDDGKTKVLDPIVELPRRWFKTRVAVAIALEFLRRSSDPNASVMIVVPNTAAATQYLCHGVLHDGGEQVVNVLDRFILVGNNAARHKSCIQPTALIIDDPTVILRDVLSDVLAPLYASQATRPKHLLVLGTPVEEHDAASDNWAFIKSIVY